MMRYLLFVLIALSAGAAVAEEPVKLLYNGIRLPDPWPPRLQFSREPMPVPYLHERPTVVPIDVGRQLFVDDFLIHETTLKRTYHLAEPYSGNPVVQPDRPWENTTPRAVAMVFSDGVWYDPADQLFKMWYMGAWRLSTCFATSKDGLHWEKPSLDVETGTNVSLKHGRDSSTVWLDLNEPDPMRRYKMFSYEGGTLALRVSADGIHWSAIVGHSPGVGDRTTVFYNPFRKMWVYSVKGFAEVGGAAFGRARYYREHADAEKGLQWSAGDVVPWLCADRLDPFNPKQYPVGARDGRGVVAKELAHSQLYNLDATAYESLMLGLFAIWQGDPAARGNQKRNEVILGYSRDGFHWHRPDRRPFLGIDESDAAWNWGNVQSAGGGCLVVGDKLYFYHSGWRDRASGPASTGLAFLRRDGFASMDAGENEGTLTTRPITFSGRLLFVNVAAANGQLQVEVLDESGKPVEPFTRSNCVAVSANTTLAPVKWTGADDLSAVANKPVRLRFHLSNGRLYSFWVSPDVSGASGGYMAAGGPGLIGPTDTVGTAAYEAANAR